MRNDVRAARRGRWFTFIGANRELRRLSEYLYDDEVVHDLLPCSFGTTGGRALLVITDERVIAYKDGWIFRDSQSMSYKDIGTVKITTGLFFAKMELKGEGMHFEISQAGRFSADHTRKIIQNRIGSRYPRWEAERAREKGEGSQTPSQQDTTPSQMSYAPEEPALHEEVPTLDKFLPSLTGENHTGANANLIDELERLEALKDRGVLSQEEYAAAKHKLLS